MTNKTWKINYKENSDISTGIQYGDDTMLFLSDEELKNPKNHLYAYAEVENGSLYVKFGEAFKETVFDRYKTTGHTANKRMLRVWPCDVRDIEVLDYMNTLTENGLGFTKAPSEILNTREAYKIDDYESLVLFFSYIDKFLNKEGTVEKKDTPVFSDILELVDSIDLSKYTKFCFDLCVRWGKTKTNLLVMEKTASRIHLMCSYVGTVRKSYKDELMQERRFENILFVDPDTQEDVVGIIENWLSQNPNNQIFYYVPLTGTFDNNIGNGQAVDDIHIFQKRVQPLYSLKHYTFDMFVEETDFGAYCEKQVKKLRKLYKDLNCRYFFSATGTNAERTNIIFDCDKYIKRDYIYDILGKSNNGRKNPVKIKWTILDNSSYLKTGFADICNFENFNDLFDLVDENGRERLKGESYFESFFKYLFNNQITSGNPIVLRNMKKLQHTLIDTLPSTDKNGRKVYPATIIYTPIGNHTHTVFKRLLERTLGNQYLIKVIDGDRTSNKDAEEYAKNAIEAATIKGKKVIFIASGMANRSFSVKEIKNVILLINDASYASIVQKIARAFTPWNKEHTEAHIIDFRLNYSSTGSSCAAKYLIGLGSDKIADGGLDAAQQVSEIIEASDKIIFEELMFGEKEPLKKLSAKELDIMMHTASYARRVVDLMLNEMSELVTVPRMCNYDGRSSRVMVNNNAKGDSKRHLGKNGKRTTSKEDKEALEERNTIRDHACFVIDNPNIFNTDRFDHDIWRQEIDDIASDSFRIEQFEETYGMDFRTIKDVVDWMLIRKILNDEMF